MAFTWLLAIAVYMYVAENSASYSYLSYLIYAERSYDNSTALSFVFLFVQFAFFVCGTIAAGGTPSTVPLAVADRQSTPLDVGPLVKLTLFTTLIASLWLGGAILQAGGVGALAALAASENTAAREILQAASFPGGRLLSYGFIGLATLSAAYLVRAETVRQRTTLIVILMISFTFLALMPILVAGRITFFVACIGAFLAACLSARRFIGIQYLIVGAVLIVAVWTLKQYYTLGHIQAASDLSAGSQSYEGMLFYFYNDVLNALNGFELVSGYHTYGWYSMRFVFFMTFTDGIFLNFIADSRYWNAQWLTAGEIPLLSGVYVDFGLFGTILIAIFGYASRYFYARCTKSPIHAATYGMIFSGLLLSTHSGFLTSQELAYNFILMFVCARIYRRKEMRARRIAAARYDYSPAIPLVSQ